MPFGLGVPNPSIPSSSGSAGEGTRYSLAKIWCTSRIVQATRPTDFGGDPGQITANRWFRDRNALRLSDDRADLRGRSAGTAPPAAHEVTGMPTEATIWAVRP